MPPTDAKPSRARRASSRRSAALLGLSLLAAACASKRELVITSEPQGAEVRVGDQAVGETPVRLPFDYYGTRRVNLYLDGYVSHSQEVKLKAPWYAWPVLDFFSEVLWPIPYEDIHELHVELQPAGGRITHPDLDALLERAQLLRTAGPEGPRPVPEEPEPEEAEQQPPAEAAPPSAAEER